MKNRKIISAIAIILAFLMAFSLVLSVLPITASAVSQSDIDAAQEKKDKYSETIAALDEKLEELKEEQATVMVQKDILDERSVYVKEQIALTQEQIDAYAALIKEEQQIVERAKEAENEQLELYRIRVRAMEERGSYNILALIMKSDSFSQLITAIDDVGEIMQSDRELEDSYIAAREAYENVLANYEEVKLEYDAAAAVLEEEKAELEQKLNEADELLAELANNVEKAEEEQRIAQEARDAADAEIKDLTEKLNAQNAAIEAARRAAEAEASAIDVSVASGEGIVSAESVGVTGTGSLCWPVPSSHRVSSCYKMRNGRMHSGVDIDGYGLDGNPVVACDSGVVVTSSYSGSYGNYVIIDHGSGMQTVYAHMAGNAVSYGDTVSQGQTIGYLGRSGNATGTHCHLEVIINGSKTDPLSYFSGYELEPGAAD